MDTNSIIAAIDAEIGKLQEVHALLSGVDTATPVKEASIPAKEAVRRRPRLSPTARKRMAEAQKKRWAAVKAAKAVVKLSPATKRAKETPARDVAIKKAPKRRKLSPEAKKRIAEAQRKRWAAVKAAKKAPAKKAAIAKTVPAKAAKKVARKASAVKAKKAVAVKSTVPAAATKVTSA